MISTAHYQHHPQHFKHQNHSQPHYYSCGKHPIDTIIIIRRPQPTTKYDTNQIATLITLIKRSTKERTNIHPAMRPTKGPTANIIIARVVEAILAMWVTIIIL